MANKIDTDDIPDFGVDCFAGATNLTDIYVNWPMEFPIPSWTGYDETKVTVHYADLN